MSGGVDSSTAAALVQRQEGDAFGITMRLFPAPGEAGQGSGRPLPVAGPRRGRCCGGDDTEVARRAAHALGLPFYVLDFEAAFRTQVVEPFAAAYHQGRTPIPCAECNTILKFDHLLRRVKGMGADRLATGHYARTGRDPGSGRRTLSRGIDRDKDQSYFLHGLTQEMLEHVVFPVGELNKQEVRAQARGHGLPNADKAESQDICFIPDGDYRSFVQRLDPRPATAGQIVDPAGRVLGRHDGISRFTVGQRRGLGLGGGERLYVLALDAASRRVVVGPREMAMCSTLKTGPVNWVSCSVPGQPLACQVQIRHRHHPAEATVTPCPDGSTEVRFARPVLAPAPGQTAVFYAEDLVLGGGPIAATASGDLALKPPAQDSVASALGLGLPA
jgi:tRNA-specific 2-thiouridylase